MNACSSIFQRLRNSNITIVAKQTSFTCTNLGSSSSSRLLSALFVDFVRLLLLWIGFARLLFNTSNFLQKYIKLKEQHK